MAIATIPDTQCVSPIFYFPRAHNISVAFSKVPYIYSTALYGWPNITPYYLMTEAESRPPSSLGINKIGVGACFRFRNTRVF